MPALCLFLEAHNMADMCFVIVSTTSSLLAYRGRLLATSPPIQHGGLLEITAGKYISYECNKNEKNEYKNACHC